MCIGSEVSSWVTPTYISIIDESFHKRLHVLNLLSSLQQEQHIHRLLTRHCAKTCSQINTVVTPRGLNDWNMCLLYLRVAGWQALGGPVVAVWESGAWLWCGWYWQYGGPGSSDGCSHQPSSGAEGSWMVASQHRVLLVQHQWDTPVSGCWWMADVSLCQ